MKQIQENLVMQRNKRLQITKCNYQTQMKLSSRQNSHMWLQFCLSLIKKMKHQIYGLFQNNNPQINQIKSGDITQMNEHCQIKAIDFLDNEVDGLAILQSGIFQKYQFYINTLIQQQSSLLHIQSNLKERYEIQKEMKDNDEFKSYMDSTTMQQLSKCQQQTNNIVISLLNQLKINQSLHGLQQQKTNSLESDQDKLQNMINLLQNQHKLSINLLSNCLTIKFISEQQFQKHLSSQTNKQPIVINKQSTLNSPYKSQSLSQQSQQQQQQQQSQSNTNKYLSAQRQLQFLIKQKQLNKKIQQCHQQIQQLKSLLQLKQLQMTQKQQQINQLNKNLDKLNHLQNKQHKVNLLKHKIQKQSLIRQLYLQRERDSLQLLIQKQNINANLSLDSNINSSNLKSLHLGLNSTLKYGSKSSKSIIKTPRSQENSNQTDQNLNLNQIN